MNGWLPSGKCLSRFVWLMVFFSFFSPLTRSMTTPSLPVDFFDKIGGDSIGDEFNGEARRLVKTAAKYQPPTVFL